MTMFGASWGLGLLYVPPIAKLVAIRLGDGCDADAAGVAYFDDLQEWCCASQADIRHALEVLAVLQKVAWVEQPDGSITYELPAQARPLRRGETRRDPNGSVYVMRGRLGLKIGITQSVQQRVEALKLATLDDAVELLWSANHRMSVIRKVERHAHAALAAKLIRNEWFAVTQEEAVAAVQAAFKEIVGS